MLLQNQLAKVVTACLRFVRNNSETILFFLLLLFLPTQFGKHFWFPFSFIHGQRIDYLAPTVYVTDVLVLLLFISNRKSSQKLTPERFCKPLRNGSGIDDSNRYICQINDILPELCGAIYKIAPAIIIFLLLNIFLSQSPLQSLYGLIKIIEIVFLIYYTRTTLRKHPNILVLPFVVGIIFESALAIAQFFNQGSLNGIFYYLGERTFTSVTPGIANASINGELILRPYGTFSHPNVLAGYLVIGMTIILMRITNYELRITNLLCWLSIFGGTMGLFFTLSRVAIILWIVVFLFLLIKSFKKKILASYFLLLTSAVLLLFPLLLSRFTWTGLQDESVSIRWELAYDALQMLFAHPFFGVGMHSFLIALPSFDTNRLALQPVHNIFLLTAAETGFLGLWLVVSFVIWLYIRLFVSLRRNVETLQCNVSTMGIILLTEVIMLGSFDHYFLTLQQGQLLLGIVLGIILAKM